MRAMGVINPVPKESASSDVHPIYDAITKKYGRMLNVFGIMSHRPGVLQKFLPAYQAILTEGTIEPKLKELAYLKAAQVNGCEY